MIVVSYENFTYIDIAYVHPCVHACSVIIPILLDYAVEIGIRDITTV
jgi:hypothetical protein